MADKIKKIYQFVRYGLVKRHVYAATSPLRVLPECAVIGTGKGGTTALHYYLGQHPCIGSSAYDELGFFNENYHLGINWYKSLFPTKFTRDKIIKKHGKFLTYDVTPQYLREPYVAKRMFQTFPKMKLIVLLRNPIDKSYSHHIMGKNSNTLNNNPEWEGIDNKQVSFEDIVNRDIEFISKYEKKNGELNDNYFRNVITKTNLARGFYAQFLRKWFDVYDRKQFLILSSSELANSTQKTLNKIFNFLEIPEYDIPDITKINTQKYEPMKKQTREILIQFFKKYNNELYELIDRRFDWDK